MKPVRKAPNDAASSIKSKPATSLISRHNLETMLRLGMEAGNALACDEPPLVMREGLLDHFREA